MMKQCRLYSYLLKNFFFFKLFKLFKSFPLFYFIFGRFNDNDFQIATLLKIPGVQQVAVIQNNGRMPDNMMMKPEVVPNG